MWVLNAHENSVNYIFLGKTQWRLKEKKSHYNTQSFVWTANPSPTFANSQTHESIHLYTMLVQTMAMHMTHNILVPHHTINAVWKDFPGLVCLLEVVGVT